MLPVGVNVPGVCAIAEAMRNERKIKVAIPDAVILWQFGSMSRLQCNANC